MERKALQYLLETVEAAIKSGDWKVDGACDPDLAIRIARVALEQPGPVQVSALDFVEMTLEKEHLVGRPIIWAEWPTEEKK